MIHYNISLIQGIFTDDKPYFYSITLLFKGIMYAL